ncbi:MAG: ABC transporter permease subunit [Chloroflexota bacterium]|nr:ABC transporter permease subunit [Chloroflexota bacterium]
MTQLVLVELFKLRKRWMLWILLGILIAFLALTQFGMYFGYRSVENESRGQVPMSERERGLREMRQALTLPRSVEFKFEMTQSVGGILLVILAASVFGAEYAWGTVRSTLIRGVSRANYLIAKLTAVLLIGLAGLVVALVVGVLLTLITTAMLRASVDWSFLSGLFFPRLLAMVGRTWFVMAIPVSLAVMVSVLTRSSAFGIGIGIAYGILETIVVGILGNISGWGEAVSLYTIGYNTTAVMAWNSLSGEPFSMGFRLGGDTPGTMVNFWKAWGLLVGYGAFFLALTFYVFKKRDISAS